MLKADVPQLVKDLLGAGLSHIEIKLRCGVRSRSAVWNWESGEKRPSLDPGVALLLLHAEIFPDCSPLRTALELQPRERGDFQDQLSTGGNDDGRRSDSTGSGAGAGDGSGND